MFVSVELIHERHEAAETRQPGEYLKEAEKPKGTLKAQFAKANDEHHGNERQHAKHERAHERKRIDKLQMIVEVVCFLYVVGQLLTQMFERVFFDELGAFEVEILAKTIRGRLKFVVA